MRGFQASFSSGEISPLLHGRIDLSRYLTGLSKLENMIVLPQGGVTRRAGFVKIGNALHNEGVKLIPFVYNVTDSAMLEFGDRNIRVWSEGSAGYEVKTVISSPYSDEDVKDLRYVQSGNVIFLAHVKYKPMMLTRESIYSWKIEELTYHDGPFVSGAETGAVLKLRTAFSDGIYRKRITASRSIFSSDMTGMLLNVEYAVGARTVSIEAGANEKSSEDIEVKGTLNVSTSGNWTGKVSIYRNDVEIRQYTRSNTETQGQWDCTITETEDGAYYHVRAISGQNYNGDMNAASQSGTVRVNMNAAGFLKRETYTIQKVESGFVVEVNLTGHETTGVTELKFWSMGAWGSVYGYPRAVCMHQDRLVFAGSKFQPQTIWMSRTGDYADFGTSYPLRDDDAVNITLAGSSSDGIHSLVSAGNLLAFTGSGEWQIRGNSDSGAISPGAISASEQTTLGSKNIQPQKVNGRIIMIQKQGRKVYTLGYDLNTDGYTGAELSVMSEHIFEGKEITSMSYQQEPDSLLWFGLNDGTAAVCTYNPEHEVTGWSRQSNPEIRFLSFSSIPGKKQSELFCEAVKGNGRIIMKAGNRIEDEDYRDWETEYESVMKTLRITMGNEDGVSYASKKLISRLVVYALKSKAAWVSPKDFERRQKIYWEDTDGLSESEIEIDNGFDEDAVIQIRNMGNGRLTITGISPVITIGG